MVQPRQGGGTVRKIDKQSERYHARKSPEAACSRRSRGKRPRRRNRTSPRASSYPFTPFQLFLLPPNHSLPRPSLMLSFSPALSFKQEPVSFPLTAGHYAATTRVSVACQSFPNGRFSRRTHPTVPAICRGDPTGRSALHFN